MINTVKVRVDFIGIPHPGIDIWHPCVLLAAQQVLAARPGVVQAPDLLTARVPNVATLPVFVAAFDDQADGRPMQVTTLLEWLTTEAKARILFDHEGGWGEATVTLGFTVVGL